MSNYTIQYLEQLSGIKAHTIRIWEQRYGILKPKRSETNIRSYTDNDLKKILGISTLLSTGYKIGDLVHLSLPDIHNRVDELEQAILDDTKIDFAAINALVAAAMTYDESAFEKTYTKLRGRLGIEHIYLYIIHPFLVRIGTLWNIGKIIPAQEHFVSNLIRQKLFSAIDSLEKKQLTECWVLYLPENEDHEIGLLFAHYMLRLFGKKTIYLGQRVPFANVKQVVAQTNATGILCFKTVQQTAKENEKFIHNFSSFENPLQKVICSGSTVFDSSLLQPVKWISKPDQFIHWLKSNA